MAELFNNLFSNLPTLSMPRFGISSVLDIAFITFVSYKLLTWIKQTRAWTLFRGIVTVIMVYFAATILFMDTTVWIIDQSLSYVILAALIIFQPELRKALESLGKNRNIPFLNPLDDSREANTAKTVEEITAAAFKMAKVQTGALIVIEQKVPLGDLEATGVTIDAAVTSQLLINIFERNTPLHDGAVLIRENRVNAASCILPLTAGHLSGNLGTRHRAAVGASEASDAYVLIVSEESGKVSIAKEGKLYPNLNESEVKAMLLENVKPSKARKFGQGFGKKGKKKR